MEAQIQNMRGLARVIFEEMVYASELVPNPSALWTSDNFLRLQEGLRARLAPDAGDKSKTFFNMIFDRSLLPRPAVCSRASWIWPSLSGVIPRSCTPRPNSLPKQVFPGRPSLGRPVSFDADVARWFFWS